MALCVCTIACCIVFRAVALSRLASRYAIWCKVRPNSLATLAEFGRSGQPLADLPCRAIGIESLCGSSLRDIEIADRVM